METEYTDIAEQTIIVCQLCESNNAAIKWKCIDCSLLMCSTCKDKIHPKVRLAKNHKIIELKDVTEQCQHVNFDNIQCEYHGGQICCLFCTTCDILVCQVCITHSHSKHDLVQIKHGYEIKVKQTENIKKKVDSKIKQFVTALSNLENVNTKERSKYEKCKQDMDENRRMVLMVIDQYYDKLHKDLESKWQDISSVIDKEHNRIAVLQKAVQKKSFELDCLLNSNDPINFFRKANALKEKINPSEKLDLLINYSDIPTFVKGELNSFDHELICGKLPDSMPCQFRLVRTDKIALGIIKHHTAKSPDIKALEKIVGTDDNDTLWVKFGPSSNVRKIRLVDDSVEDMHSFNIVARDIARTSEGELLVAENMCNQLKLVHGSKKELKTTDYNVSSTLRTTAVHVMEKTIFIGVVEGNPFGGQEAGKILIMGMNGERVNNYKHDKSLFTFPYRIETNSIGDIIVIDALRSNGLGRVVVLGQQGEKAIYTGTQIDNKDSAFTPYGMAITKLDNILVANRSIHNLLVLNPNAEYIVSINLREMGILFPISLHIKNNNMIYIGCEKVKGSNENAKIHVGNIIGC